MSNLLSLLKQKKFSPLFFVQFTGAFNDNIFKNALVILLAFNATILPTSISSTLALNITGALLILPFFLFSAIAGQLADSYEKTLIIFRLKVAEVVLMIFGAFGLWSENLFLIWGVIFGLGIQAAFFGPIKYSILPQLLNEDELIAGNALIESGTFLAILLGTILGGLLIVLDYGFLYVSFFGILTSIAGLIFSTLIPKAPSLLNESKISYNIFTESFKILKTTYHFPAIFKSVLAISWFWFIGALLLTEFPLIIKEIIGGNPSIVTLFLTVFSFGIISGAILSEKFSKQKVEIGLVPLGSLGMIIFLTLFIFNLDGFEHLGDGNISIFLESTNSFFILINLFFVSLSGGLFTVPLYAFIQETSPPDIRSRIIGANNIINSFFMVLSAIFTVILFNSGANLVTLLYSVVILHIIITTYIFIVIPEFIVRFVLWLIFILTYNIKTNINSVIPKEGSALIICNSISSFDPIFIFAAIYRPIKFPLSKKFYDRYPKLFNSIGAFPVDYSDFDNTLSLINEHLSSDEVVLFLIPKEGLSDNYLKLLNEIKESYSYPVIKADISGTEYSIFNNQLSLLKRIGSLKLRKVIKFTAV